MYVQSKNKPKPNPTTHTPLTIALGRLKQKKITISQGQPGLYREILFQTKTKFKKTQSKSLTVNKMGQASVTRAFGSGRYSSVLELEGWLSG